MQLPGLPSLLFLLYLLILLPWAALRSYQHFRKVTSGTATLPPRPTIWINTLASQLVMLVFAWLVAILIGYPLFQVPGFGVREVAAGLAALGLYFLLRKISQMSRSDEERRRLIVFAIAPRTREEWLLWSATVIAASIAEEAAYRGIGLAVLSYALGNAYVAAAICSLAFALAHGPQGPRSMLVIFFMAIVMHVLVWITGTLVIAMIVHAIYDFVAGYLISREARGFDAAATMSGAT